MKWFTENAQWVFGGIGVTVLGAIAKYLLWPAQQKEKVSNHSVVIHNHNTVGNTNSASSDWDAKRNQVADLDSSKARVRILFIDDQDFKVVQILKKSGWQRAKAIKEVISLDSQDIKDADIVFIDINGVGLKLGFKDQGLGIVNALKDKYPKKRLVIYSSEDQGPIFHSAFKRADAKLSKNADPYEFIHLVEQYAVEYPRSDLSPS